MAAKSESEPKSGFFDHSINFFKGRASKSDDRKAQNRVASLADPYGHVDSGKPKAQPKGDIDFRADPNAPIPESFGPSSTSESTVRKGDSLEVVYSILAEHGGVSFGAQLADGTWELSAYHGNVSTLDTLEPQGPSLWQEKLSPEADAKIAAALKALSAK